MRIADIKYDHLLGRRFVHGSTDCYGFVRDFYKDNFGLELTDYARPDRWWDDVDGPGLNLYMDHFHDEGFFVVDNPRPVDLKPCDLFLCAIRSKVANHAAVHLGDGWIGHHFIDRLSSKDLYSGLWRNTTVAVLRHSTLRDLTFEKTYFDLSKDPRIAARFANARA